MSEPAQLAAVFEGDYQVSRAVATILADRGFAAVSFDERPSDLVATVRSLGAEVVVLELAMVGVQGLQVVRDLLQAVPGCAVLLLSPFDTLRQPALAAGAFALVGSDLRALDRCLAQLETHRPGPVSISPPGAPKR